MRLQAAFLGAADGRLTGLLGGSAQGPGYCHDDSGTRTVFSTAC